VHVPVIGHPNAETFPWGRSESAGKLGTVDADAEARHRLETKCARFQQSVECADARVDAAALDASDCLLWDSRYRGELALRHAGSPPRVPDHPPGHRQGKGSPDDVIIIKHRRRTVKRLAPGEMEHDVSSRARQYTRRHVGPSIAA